MGEGNYRGPWTVELFKIFAVIVIYTAFLTTQKILVIQPSSIAARTQGAVDDLSRSVPNRVGKSPFPISWVDLFSPTLGLRRDTVSGGEQQQPGHTLPRNATRKYVTTGNDINCKHMPINQNGTGTDLFYWPAKEEGARYAYAWYVTDARYFCSAIVALQRLKLLRKTNPVEGFTYEVDFVIIHSSDDIKSSDMAKYVKDWERNGGKLAKFPSLKKFVKNGYYRGSLQKLEIFLLTQYKRVISMDADGVPVKNLDHLFLLKLPENVSIAAPQGYWFHNEGVVTGTKDDCDGMVFPMITSILMLFEPSQHLFDRVKPYFGTVRPVSKLEFFDMDIVQKEFSCSKEIFVLPKVYGTLDSDFNKKFALYKDKWRCRSFQNVQYLHFTHKGKPWTHPKGWNQNYYLKEFPPDVTDFFREWFQAASQQCPSFVSAI